METAQTQISPDLNQVTLPTSSAAKAAFAADLATQQKQVPNDAGLETWCDLVKGSKRLQKKDKPFQLPSGESFVEIPDSVIEKNKKGLGQFHYRAIQFRPATARYSPRDCKRDLE
ncbi:hypothetical protein V5N11_031371 [Cardamine amara subsp. amara]|uniref:Uncharacterized protein n=1 Tax=Cardamine amara subsp. amara TaxID=228776 RepID=A0ABD1A7D9_CARAN